jgi:hypothetical protein
MLYIRRTTYFGLIGVFFSFLAKWVKTLLWRNALENLFL